VDTSQVVVQEVSEKGELWKEIQDEDFSFYDHLVTQKNVVWGGSVSRSYDWDY